MADYYPLISRAVGALDDKKSKEARHALYDRARATLADQLRRVDPPLSEKKLEHERLALEDAVGKVEADAILSAQKEQIVTRTFGSILLFAIIFVGIVFVGMALSAPMLYRILYLIVTLAVLLGIVWAPHVSPSFQDRRRYPMRSITAAVVLLLATNGSPYPVPSAGQWVAYVSFLVSAGCTVEAGHSNAERRAQS
jgi:hypothetical protein